MDWPYVHLLINHFPIILTVTGAAAALAALVLRRRGLWLYAVASLTLSALAIYPAFFTGDEAKDTLERLHPWYIVRGSIDSHEEAAEVTLWVLLAMGLVTWTSLLGGKIVHKSPILAAPQPPAIGSAPARGATAPP